MDDGGYDTAYQVLMTNAEAMKRGVLAIWTVYDRPRDHPDGFIARRYEITEDLAMPTKDTIVGDLATIRTAFLKAGLHALPREDADEPQVVESWV